MISHITPLRVTKESRHVHSTCVWEFCLLSGPWNSRFSVGYETSGLRNKPRMERRVHHLIGRMGNLWPHRWLRMMGVVIQWHLEAHMPPRLLSWFPVCGGFFNSSPHKIQNANWFSHPCRCFCIILMQLSCYKMQSLKSTYYIRKSHRPRTCKAKEVKSLMF